MITATIICANSKDYRDVIMVTEIWVPACNVWVGDYPYLIKTKFRKLLSDRTKQQKLLVTNSELKENDIPNNEKSKLPTRNQPYSGNQGNQGNDLDKVNESDDNSEIQYSLDQFNWQDGNNLNKDDENAVLFDDDDLAKWIADVKSPDTPR